MNEFTKEGVNIKVMEGMLRRYALLVSENAEEISKLSKQNRRYISLFMERALLGGREAIITHMWSVYGQSLVRLATRRPVTFMCLQGRWSTIVR